MRSIDADKLLSDIEKYHVSDGKFQHWIQIQPTIESEHKAEEWIPVTERLPEEPNMYTVTDSKGDVVRFVYTGTDSSREYWLRCAKAWMQLPKPYEEKGEER